jgi:cobalt-zinc-cadmium efflux system protein
MDQRPTVASRHSGRLAAAVAISAGILAVDVVAGIASHSLALLADAGHVFADVSAMLLSLGAVRLAGRPRSDDRTFGLSRLEILAAALNAAILLAIAGAILFEAIRRLADPPEVQPELISVVAAAAILANLVAARLLVAGRAASLTIRAAYLEVLSDLAGSVAVLIAGLVILVTGWRQADAVASIGVAILIVPRTLGLLRESLDVLLEATPKGVDLDHVRQHILEAPGVVGVHDLHAWTITSGMNVVSAHVVLGPEAEAGAVLDHLGTCLSDDFDVNHSTFQLETPEHVAWEARSAQPQH